MYIYTKSAINRTAYNKRNHVVSVLKNEKKNFYSNLDTKVVTNNMFWKTVIQFFLKRLLSILKLI